MDKGQLEAAILRFSFGRDGLDTESPVFGRDGLDAASPVFGTDGLDTESPVFGTDGLETAGPVFGTDGWLFFEGRILSIDDAMLDSAVIGRTVSVFVVVVWEDFDEVLGDSVGERTGLRVVERTGLATTDVPKVPDSASTS